MQKRRLFFSFLFFLGTLLAVYGWGGEELHRLGANSSFALVGHLLQVLGAFGNLVTPDAIEEEHSAASAVEEPEFEELSSNSD